MRRVLMQPSAGLAALRSRAYQLPPASPCRVTVRQWSRSGRSQVGKRESDEFKSRSDPNVLAETKNRAVAGIWYVPNPSATEPSVVISKLPQLGPQDRDLLRRALFVVTPGLAKWFEPGNTFHQDAINKIYTPFQPGTSDLKSFVAVVDGLPAPEDIEDFSKVDRRPCAPVEGIAIYLATRLRYSLLTTGYINGPPLLRFMSQRIPKAGHVLGSDLDSTLFSNLSVPLPNTLFVNGRQHTAFCQNWKSAMDGSSLCAREPPADIAELSVDFGKQVNKLFHHYVPLRSITREREVISSMGNIVREVRGDHDDSVLRASAELEAAVPKILALLKDHGDPQLQIFARVMPLGKLSQKSAGVSTQEFDVEDRFRKVRYRKAHTALTKGGKLYRVQSGGGGWGKKAGLLSLDPAVNFQPSLSSESSMFPDLDQDELVPPGVTALVPAGHTVQFLAVTIWQLRPSRLLAKSNLNPDDALIAPESWSSLGRHGVLIGTTAATDAPQPDSGQENQGSASVTVLPGQFGLLSEIGVSVSLSKGDLATRTESGPGYADIGLRNEFRIDVPSSIFRSDFGDEDSDPGKGPSEPAHNRIFLPRLPGSSGKIRKHFTRPKAPLAFRKVSSR